MLWEVGTNGGKCSCCLNGAMLKNTRAQPAGCYVVACTCHLKTQEAEAEMLEFEASLNYRARPCLKKPHIKQSKWTTAMLRGLTERSNTRLYRDLQPTSVAALRRNRVSGGRRRRLPLEIAVPCHGAGVDSVLSKCPYSTSYQLWPTV